MLTEIDQAESALSRNSELSEKESCNTQMIIIQTNRYCRQRIRKEIQPAVGTEHYFL